MTGAISAIAQTLGSLVQGTAETVKDPTIFAPLTKKSVAGVIDHFSAGMEITRVHAELIRKEREISDLKSQKTGTDLKEEVQKRDLLTEQEIEAAERFIQGA